MYKQSDKTQKSENKSAANIQAKEQNNNAPSFEFIDNRPETIVQRKTQGVMANYTTKNHLVQKKENNAGLFQFEDNRPEAIMQRKMQGVMANYTAQNHPIQKKENNTGLPDNLKSGIENLSGYSMDDVKVHYNSDKPSQLQAHAYAQGANIHVAPNQEKHLPHEAWHVVQQKQGRVKPTLQLKGKVNVNDDVQLEKEADVMGAKAMQMNTEKTGVSLMSSSANYDTKTPTSQIVQGAFKYAAAVTLDRDTKVSDTHTDDLQIDSIALPETFRPPTKYGDTQQSHSVSWTLLKRGYTSVHDLPMNTFIDNHLIHDWNALRAQKVHMNVGDFTKTTAYQRLNQYLDTYTQAHFQTLKTNQEAPLIIQNEIRKAVSDYFIAIQLAPLSTHTGHILDLGGTNIQGFTPVSHGEPAANKKLTKIENELTVASAATETQKAEVIEKVRAYWDPGVGNQGGINDPTAVTLIATKLHTSLERSFPKIWRLYGAAISTAITTPDTDEATTIIGTHPTEANDLTAAKVTDATDINPVKFHAQIQTSDRRALAHLPPTVGVSDLKITSIHLPDDRPLTKYGKSGQKSHTVAWTLTLQAITKAAAGKNLKTFFQYMLHRWGVLNTQDWAKAAKQVLDKKTMYSHNANSARLTTLHGWIAPAIAELTTAITGGPKSDLQWTQLIQDNLSQYFEVSASAPLTTYKDGVPGGHGEADANEHLGNLETDVAGHGSSPEWSAKFQTEFVTNAGHSWKNPHYAPDSDEMKRIHGLVSGDTVLNATDTAKRNEILVRQLALKYLDIKWSAFMLPGSGAIASAETDMKVVLREWETSFKEAFPSTWTHYRGVIMEVANTYTLSHSIAARNGAHTTMAHWMEPLHKEDGLEDARKNDMNQNGSASYNTSKADYTNGLTNLRAGNADRGGSTAHDAAKDDYRTGVNQAQLNPAIALPANQHHGFNEGYNDYVQGLRLAEQQPQIALPGGHHSGWSEGYDNYRNGYLAATLAPGTMIPGGHNFAWTEAYRQFQHGYTSAMLHPIPNLPGGHMVSWNHGYTEYRTGYTDAMILPIVAVPAGHSLAYINGYNEYRNGFLTAQATPIGQLPGGHDFAWNSGWSHYHNGYMNTYANANLPVSISNAYNLGNHRGTIDAQALLARPIKRIKR